MKKRIMAFALSFLTMTAGLSAQDYKVVVPQIAPSAIEVYTKSIEAIAESQGKTVSIQVVPFARAVYMIETKQVDIQAVITQIPDKTKWAGLKYDYSTASLVDVVFVLYTNKSKPVTAAELKAGNPKKLKIETDTAHVLHFPFTSPSTNIEASLQKVDAGTIDGYIFAQGTTDAAVKRLGLKNIRREHFDTLSSVFLLQKGGRGGDIDAMLSAGLAAIKANGKYQAIVGPYAATASNYSDWQP